MYAGIFVIPQRVEGKKSGYNGRTIIYGEILEPRRIEGRRSKEMGTLLKRVAFCCSIKLK